MISISSYRFTNANFSIGILMFSLLFWSLLGLAQKPMPALLFPSDFKIENGRIDVYDIECDTNGFVYFAGPSGFNKFNNGKLKHFDVPDGTPRMYTAIYKSSKNRFWLRSFKGDLDYYDEEINHFPISSEIQRVIRSGLSDLYMDTNEILHIGLKSDGYWQLHPNGKVKKIISKENKRYGFFITQLPNGRPFHFGCRHKNSKPELPALYFLKEDGGINRITDLQSQWPLYQSTLLRHKDKFHTLSIGNNMVYQCTKDSLIRKVDLPYQVIKLFEDSEQNIWLGTLKNGVKKLVGSNWTKFESISNGAAAVVAEDSSGRLWITSSKLGFACLPSPHTKAITNENSGLKNNVVRSVSTGGNKVFFISSDNLITVIEPDTIRHFQAPKSPAKKKNSPELIVFDDKNDVLWISYQGYMARLKNGQYNWFQLPPDLFHYNIGKIELGKNGALLGINDKGLFTIESDSIKVLWKGNGAARFFIGSNNDTIITDKNGIWELKSGILERPFYHLSDDLKKEIQFIIGKKQTLLIQPRKGNVYMVRNNEPQLVMDISGSPIKTADAVIGNDSIAWFRDIKGQFLWRLNINSTKPIAHRIQVDDRALYAFKFGTLALSDSSLIIGSKDGLYFHNLYNSHRSFNAVKVVFEGVLINHKQVPKLAAYDLRYEENSFIVQYNTTKYRRIPITYKYRLLGLDTGWIETNHEAVQYTNLEPGSYCLELSARHVNEPWGATASINFYIDEPLWKNQYFRAAVLLLLILLIGLGLWYRSRKLLLKEREQVKIKLELARLELRALKAQINPHFIFNSISSVQYYLAKNKPDDAESYLQRFSILIRKILENSEHNEVTLFSEINLMQIYIDLESERLKGASIKFEVNYDQINPNLVLIPPTLFQPYIENSIWHGLRGKNGERIIKMHVTRLDNVLQIQIIDNGVGRDTVKKTSSKKQARSFGMLIASRRIAVLNPEIEKPIEIEDLIDEQGKSLGTKIIIEINYKETRI